MSEISKVFKKLEDFKYNLREDIDYNSFVTDLNEKNQELKGIIKSVNDMLTVEGAKDVDEKGNIIRGRSVYNLLMGVNSYTLFGEFEKALKKGKQGMLFDMGMGCALEAVKKMLQSVKSMPAVLREILIPG